MNHRIRYAAAFVLTLAASWAVASAQDLAAADDPMAADVLYTVPEPEPSVSPAQIEALAKAAAQPDVETRLQTLDAIRAYRFTQLSDQVKSLLADKRLPIRIAAVQAAEALKLAGTAKVLQSFLTSVPPDSSEAIDLHLAVNRALVSFGREAGSADWTIRIAQPDYPTVLRVSALHALTELKNIGLVMAAPLAIDPTQPPEVRLAAAEAFAQLRFSPPLLDAAAKAKPQIPYDKFLAGSLIDRLVAAHLLCGDPADSAVALLQRCAGDGESVVRVIALAELKRRGAGAMTMPIIEAAMKSDDPKVRLVAIESLPLHVMLHSVELAGVAMNDPHPADRAAARASLESLDGTQVGGEVRKLLLGSLQTIGGMDADGQAGHWGDAEQWALLARNLNEKRAAESLVKLLDHPRVEVVVAAVKALRRLDVAETRPAVMGLLQRLTEQMEKGKPVNDPNREISRQAAMTLGVWRMSEADALLRRAISKTHPMGIARPAVIWALGMIHEGKPDGALTGQFVGRINDTQSEMPESEDVRIACVIAMGRMNSQPRLGVLRKYLASDQESAQMHYACWWAIDRITGQTQPAPVVPPREVRVPFLSPMH